MMACIVGIWRSRVCKPMTRGSAISPPRKRGESLAETADGAAVGAGAPPPTSVVVVPPTPPPTAAAAAAAAAEAAAIIVYGTTHHFTTNAPLPR